MTHASQVGQINGDKLHNMHVPESLNSTSYLYPALMGTCHYSLSLQCFNSAGILACIHTHCILPTGVSNLRD